MRLAAMAVVLGSSVVLAQEAAPEGQSWSVVGPKTVASGQNALEAGVGWPGLTVSYLRGVAEAFNLGGRVGFVYGVEGQVRTQVAPGIKLQALVKVRLLDRDRVSLGVTFEPGPVIYTYPGTTVFAFTMPLGFRLGIAASSALSLAVLLDLPMWISFGSFASFNLPILTGVGIEYFVQSTLALFFRTRMGPTVSFRGFPAEFTFEGVVGVGWRF